MTVKIKCIQCNLSGGTIPKWFWDDVVSMMHEECAIKNIERYLARKEKEASAHTG